LSIKIFYDDVDFKLPGSRRVIKTIIRIIEKEDKIPGDLNLIFTSDLSLRNINKEFLQHDYYTDVVAFDSGSSEVVSGEIYISIDTVRLNALNYNVSLRDEVLRVMFHGVLHLCGYRDKKVDQRERMRELESLWIKIYLEGML
jgi:rRNA maturation RNase YbeY